MCHMLANTQYVARWDKSGKRKKSGIPPTFFTVPSPVQPPLGLIFDILIFSYTNKFINFKRMEPVTPEDKGFIKSNPANYLCSIRN